MGDPNTVSVILPYFNRADSLERAVKSVLSQTHDDLVLYLVNDGSTDSSSDVAKSFADKRVRHLNCESNSGHLAARNLGLAVATTDLVAHMDSDDEWFPSKLESQIAYLRETQAAGEATAVMGCGWRYATGGVAPNFKTGPFARGDIFWSVSGTGLPLLLVDRSVATNGACFDPSFPALGERDYLAACLLNGSRLRVLPDVLAEVTRGRGDHNASPLKASAAWERYLEKYALDLSKDSELLSWYHFRAAREHLVAGNRARAWNHLSGALRFRPARRALHIALGALGGSTGLAAAQKMLPL